MWLSRRRWGLISVRCIVIIIIMITVIIITRAPSSKPRLSSDQTPRRMRGTRDTADPGTRPLARPWPPSRKTSPQIPTKETPCHWIDSQDRAPSGRREISSKLHWTKTILLPPGAPINPSTDGGPCGCQAASQRQSPMSRVISQVIRCWVTALTPGGRRGHTRSPDTRHSGHRETRAALMMHQLREESTIL